MRAIRVYFPEKMQKKYDLLLISQQPFLFSKYQYFYTIIVYISILGGFFTIFAAGGKSKYLACYSTAYQGIFFGTLCNIQDFRTPPSKIKYKYSAREDKQVY